MQIVCRLRVVSNFGDSDSGVGENTQALTCDQALFSFRSVKHSGGTGETKNRA